MNLETKETNQLKWRKWVILVAVCGVLLLDYMLYMVVVPIMSSILHNIDMAERTTALANNTFTKNGANDSNYWNTGAEISNRFNFSEDYANLSAELYNMESSTESTLKGFYLISNFRETSLNRTSKHTNSTKSYLETEFMNSTQDYTNKSKEKIQQDFDIRTGILFASKALVQVFIGPFAGMIIDRVGFIGPLIFGLVLLAFSTVEFAWASSYTMLMVARCIQGVGSAFGDTSALALLCAMYTSDKERSQVLGIGLACISLGVVLGPPFGGFFFEYFSPSVPFYILTCFIVLDLIIVIFAFKQDDYQATTSNSPTSIFRLLIDPYITVCAVAFIMSNVSFAFVEPIIARWMIETMDASEFQIGIVWFFTVFPHILGVIITVKLTHKFPTYPWLMAAIGLTIQGLSCLLLPLCRSVATVALPLMMCAFGLALVDTSLLPVLAYLVDTRHTSVYGSVYAIADVSYSVAYALGPIVADSIYQKLGFTGLNIVICIVTVLYVPVLISLFNIYKKKSTNSTSVLSERRESIATEQSSLVSPNATSSTKYCYNTEESSIK